MASQDHDSSSLSTVDDAGEQRRARAFNVIGFGAFALALLVVFPAFASATDNNYLLSIGFLTSLYALLAVGWNVVGGWCGDFDFGPQVFFAIGAYAVALGVRSWEWGFWPPAIVGIAVAVSVCAVLTYPLAGLRGHYFAIGTAVIWLIALAIATNWHAIGAGEGLLVPRSLDEGLWSDLRNLQFGGFDSNLYYYFAAAASLFGVLTFAAWLRGTRFGYRLRAIRDDQEAAEALGINARLHRVMARCVTAAVYGFGGAIYAAWQHIVVPEQVLDFTWALIPTMAVVVGGIGTLWGPVLGAFILVPLSQQLSTRLGTGALAGRSIDLLIFGTIIMVIAASRPRGILSFPWQRWWRTLVSRVGGSTQT